MKCCVAFLCFALTFCELVIGGDTSFIFNVRIHIKIHYLHLQIKKS